MGAFKSLLADVPSQRKVLLLALMVMVALTDGLGILLLVPLLEALQQSSVDSDSWITALWQSLDLFGLRPDLLTLLILFVALIGIRSGTQYCRDKLSAAVQYQVVDSLRLRCFTALLAVEWRWMVRTRQADHANRLITDINRIGAGLNHGLGLLVSVMTALAYLVAALLLSWPVTLLAIGTGSLLFALLAGQRRQALALGEGLGRANQLLHSGVQESLTGMKLAKILGNEQRYLRLVSDRVAMLRQQQLRFVTNTSLSRSLFQWLGAILLAVYVYLGLTLWHTPLSQMLILVLVFARMIPLFMQGLQQLHHWLHALPAVRQAQQLLAECQANAEPAGESDTRFWPVQRDIALDGITIRYDDRERAALANVTVTFPARTTTAIMGESGAGKSTLADVLMGLLTPDTGQLLIDGVALEGDARRRWRHSVAYVPQDVFLFNDTIRNNLLWGRPGATEEELHHALQLAAADFVMGLPAGLDTGVGDGGVQLSGGERQRLALARALLKQPALLILDEATSALDVENEVRIRSAIENLRGNLTVVLIGHRLTTLEHADQVVILAQGAVRACGSWQDVREHMAAINSQRLAL